MNKNEIYNFLSTQSNIFEILRENDFKMAKEFFGAGVSRCSVSIQPIEQCRRGQNFHECFDDSLPDWKLKLQNMILLEDPLAYMKNFIKK